MSRTREVLLFALLIALPIHAGAHGTAFALQPGEVDISLYWTLSSGLQVSLLTVQNELHEIVAYEFHEVTTRFGPGSAGLNTMVEVGVLPWLSVGVVLGAPQFLLNGLQGGSYALNAAATASVYWLSTQGVSIYSFLAIEADPVVGDPAGRLTFDQGFVNVFLTPVAASVVLHRWRNNAIAVYVDPKLVTGFENPRYRTPERSFERLLMLPEGTGTDLPHVTGPLFKFAAAAGVEARFGRLLAHVGFNLPVLSFTTEHLASQLFDFYNVDIASLEFGWRVRL